MMHAIDMFSRRGALSVEGFSGSGADWLEEYKPYIEDGKTMGSKLLKKGSTVTQREAMLIQGLHRYKDDYIKASKKIPRLLLADSLFSQNPRF